MKLYRTRSGGPHGQIMHWYGTQAEATKAGREAGFSEQLEVPTDKPGLLSWLNNHTIIEGMPVDEGPGPEGPEHDPIAAAEERAVAAQSVTKEVDRNRSWDRLAIEEFILDRATVADVEGIFACIGTRFKELANGRSQNAGG